MLDPQARSVLLSYRSAYFQGIVTREHREGYGIVILDQNIVLVCNWVNDKPQGKAFAFLNHNQYAFLQFTHGHLDGYCYSCSEREMVFARFDKGRPIDRHLYANFPQKKVRIFAFKNGTYQPIQEMTLEQKHPENIINQYLGISIPIPSLSQYLHSSFCKEKSPFQLNTVLNGQNTFHFVDQKNPLSLGFIFNKKEQLIGYGHYLQQKLHGFGCKIEIHSSFEGVFEKGVYHGLGMIKQNGRHTFGRFDSGNLAQNFQIEERNGAIIDKLRELKRKEHIQSIYFENNYFPHDILSFKGISEFKTRSFPVHTLLQPQNSPLQSPRSSHLKGSNVSLNQLMSSRAYSREQDNSVPPPLSNKPQKERNGGWPMTVPGLSVFQDNPSRRFPLE